MAGILQARYTHPEDLAAALSEAEDAFPELAPLQLVSYRTGEPVERRDVLGHQPLPGTEMPPPPMPKAKLAPDQDGKTIGSCKARFSDHMNTPFGEPPIVKAKTSAADPLVSAAHRGVLDTVYEGPIEGLIDSRSAAEAAKDLPYEKEVLRVLVKHGLITKP